MKKIASVIGRLLGRNPDNVKVSGEAPADSLVVVGSRCPRRATLPTFTHRPFIADLSAPIEWPVELSDRARHFGAI